VLSWGVRGRGGKGVRETKVRALGSWDTEVTATTADHIGPVVAEIVFAKEPRARNEVVFMAGETVSYDRVAEVVEEVVGKEVREATAVGGLEEQLKKGPNDAIKKYRVVFAKGKGVAWRLEKTFNGQRGMRLSELSGGLEQT
jgi:hypothetical protein